MTTTLDPTSIDPIDLDDNEVDRTIFEEFGLDPNVPSEPWPGDWPRAILDGDNEERSVPMRDPFDSEAELRARSSTVDEDDRSKEK